MAKWIIANDLDGIDVDYEDFDAINAQDGKAEQWLITFTKTLRQQLPQGKYILTHARKRHVRSPLLCRRLSVSISGGALVHGIIVQKWRVRDRP